MWFPVAQLQILAAACPKAICLKFIDGDNFSRLFWTIATLWCSLRLHPPSRTRSSASPEAALNALIPSGDVRKTITALQDLQLQMGLDWGRFRHRLELAFQQLGKEERLGSAGKGQRTEGAP
mmetsp:Transcript_68912/g.139751  ORF Transcript_68912/g.139751 Transcript_68912/m.139751 type:complete len:122 (-) Transcript_68912:50-415(-)